MLMPASVYKEEIEKQFKAIQYTDKYLWYTGSIENYDMEVKTEDNKFAFAIVDNWKHLIGYISFRVDWYCSMAYNFGLICFHPDYYDVIGDVKAKQVMASAIREVMRMVESFNLHRIDFRCVSGNPAERNYWRLSRKIRERGKYAFNSIVFTDNIRDKQGKYHDTTVYELIRREV